MITAAAPLLHRPTAAEIDLSAVRHNVRLVRERVGAIPTIMAVVKSDAYGHGMVPVARAAMEAGATALGVATSDEALTLRESDGFQHATILVMAPTLPSEAEALQRANISVAIGGHELLAAHLETARHLGRPAKLHIQTDTGIGRDGFRFDDLEWINTLRGSEDCIDGLWMHFAVADSTTPEHIDFTNLQIDRLEVAHRALGRKVTLHAANSGAVLRHARAHFDMVRPGIMLYGIEPADEPSLEPGLRPVLKLRTAIASIRIMEPGDTVSYGRTYTMPARGPIGIVPIGYGDGLPRHLSSLGEMLVRGRRVPIRGRVCMDQTMIDLGAVPDAEIGDEVVIYGTQGRETIRVEDVAKSIGTIGYELTCRLTQRVPRVYTAS